MNNESQLLVNSAERFFSEASSAKLIEASEEGQFATDLWGELQDLGFTLASLREENGGIGFNRSDSAMLIRLAARELAPLPLAEVTAANWALEDVGLEPVLDRMVTVCSAPNANLELSYNSDNASLSGSLNDVAWSGDPALVVGVAKSGDAAHLFVLSIDDQQLQERLNYAGEKRVRLELGNRAPVATAELTHGGFNPALIYMATLRSTQMVGVMQRVVGQMIEYCNTREQFGRTIGKFQAVQQNVAVAASELAAGTATADFAVTCLNNADLDAMSFAAACAKSRCGEAATRVAEIAHQVFGAIGFTREHDLHFATRRLWSWREDAGDEAYWNRVLGQFATTESSSLWKRLAPLV